MRKEPDYYSILGVDPSATAEELRARRNRLVRELHPDRHAGDPVYLERLTEINVAFHELRDEFRRRAYDRRRREATIRTAVPVNHNMTHYGYGSTAAVRSSRPSARTEFHTVRKQAPAKINHKRQALVGAIFAAVAAGVVVLGFLVFGDIQLQPPPGLPHVVSTPSTVVPAAVTQTSLSDQYGSIEQSYQHRLSDVISDAQGTVEATSTTASILEDEGYMQKAAKLRRETTELEMKLLDAGDAVRQLGSDKDTSAEAQMEASLNSRLAKLSQFDHSLNAEQQALRNNGITTAASPRSNSSTQTSPVDAGLQSANTTP